MRKKVCTYWLREYHAANSRQQLSPEEACKWPQGCKLYELGECPFHTDNFILINLTPHPVTIVAEDGTVVMELPACPNPPRASATRESYGQVKGIPVYHVSIGEVQDLPEHRPGIGYIVSRTVAEAVRRDDLFIPDQTVRDEQGRIVGCRALAQIL
ncbi:MAG TPA: hypothetical protein PKI14_07240 [Fervidobacterium sp.]|mgnify:FL=1|nr:hypothetical protein [Fervidobacterium sp.]